MDTPIDQLELTDNPTTNSIRLLIGDELLVSLSDALGGFQLSIPSTVGENSPLAQAIGLEAARRISSVYGGFKYDIPVAPGREQRIKTLWDAGSSKSSICRQLKLTRGQVYRVIDKLEKKSQLDLFSDK